MDNNNKQAAFEAALRDIIEDCVKKHHCFFVFIERLNPIMDKLVEEELRKQESISKKIDK